MSKELSELEKEKEALINQYLELQDKIDTYNEAIYQLTCKIESINKQIQLTKQQEALSSP
jgi:uncharacterized coiled-coil DUF342 family protein